MTVSMDTRINHGTAIFKTALAVKKVQGKTKVAEASRAFDLSPSEIGV